MSETGSRWKAWLWGAGLKSCSEASPLRNRIPKPLGKGQQAHLPQGPGADPLRLREKLKTLFSWERDRKLFWVLLFTAGDRQGH